MVLFSYPLICTLVHNWTPPPPRLFCDEDKICLTLRESELNSYRMYRILYFLSRYVRNPSLLVVRLYAATLFYLWFWPVHLMDDWLLMCRDAAEVRPGWGPAGPGVPAGGRPPLPSRRPAVPLPGRQPLRGRTLPVQVPLQLTELGAQNTTKRDISNFVIYVSCFLIVLLCWKAQSGIVWAMAM